MDNFNDKPSDLTYFDSLINDDSLNIVKAALPYIQKDSRKAVSVIVKAIELTKTINIVNNDDDILSACSDNSSQGSSPLEMLTAIRDYCSKQQREMIDMLVNMYSAFNLYNVYRAERPDDDSDKKNIMSFLKESLSPEQRSMLDTYQTLLNQENI